MFQFKKKGAIFLVVLIALLITVGIVLAAGHNLTVPGNTTTINGAIFEAIAPDDATGSGAFDSFYRLSTNTLLERGYNTDFRPLQFDENNSGTFTRSRLLSEIPLILGDDGLLYREFQLDINQNQPGDQHYLTLDDVEIFESDFPSICGYPFDGTGGGQAACTDPFGAGEGDTATQIYDMDANNNSFVVLDYDNNPGSGKRDMRLLVPNSLFNQDPNCNYTAVGCTVYVVHYSEFGGDSDPGSPDSLLQQAYGNNDGFEEWGVIPSDGFERDLGDLPEPMYPTLLASNGASHIIVSGDNGMVLGAIIDAEDDGQPSADAMGDDINPGGTPDDEDGVEAIAPWSDGANGGTVEITATGGPTAGTNAWVCGWFDFGDFNGGTPDGTFDSYLKVQVPLDGTANNYQFDVPVGTYGPPGANVAVYARFRLFADEPTCSETIGYIGEVSNGEVEDYKWTFSPTAINFNDMAADMQPANFIWVVSAAFILLAFATVGLFRRNNHS